MSVARRKTSKGETAEYHYAFAHDGKRYRGVCENCKTKKQADEYERNILNTVKAAATQKSVRALVENFRDVLTGGQALNLADAYELSLKKPRKRQPSEELIRTKRSYWLDFLFFMQANYPDITTLANVRACHAEAYIQQLRTDGRFNKLISYSGTTISKTREYLHKGNLSAKTINTYQQVLSEVFQLLARDAGIVDNPFAAIPKLGREAESREAFTEQELILIRDNADDFILPLFMIAIATALREGDICTLKWDEINFRDEVIVKKMRKTGNYVEIPMLPPLKNYLLELRNHALPEDGSSTYVLPLHAQMYLENSSGVSYRIKRFLEQKCGIKTTKQLDNRSRAISVKDLHSCRHTFCYYAGLYGIPLNIVQSIVGHMTLEMTKHYSAHANLEAKREKMKQLPAFLTLIEPCTDPEESEREKLVTLAHSLPIAEVRRLLQVICEIK
ncbi:MAG: tyrosine-type recombinase/integrase [Thermoguttaceae bacterium]|nr:tyrosine-type recombinase/integrase [Thermoguttaceae bacterium]